MTIMCPHQLRGATATLSLQGCQVARMHESGQSGSKVSIGTPPYVIDVWYTLRTWSIGGNASCPHVDSPPAEPHIRDKSPNYCCLRCCLRSRRCRWYPGLLSALLLPPGLLSAAAENLTTEAAARQTTRSVKAFPVFALRASGLTWIWTQQSAFKLDDTRNLSQLNLAKGRIDCDLRS